MLLKISHKGEHIDEAIQITGSKSESNRLLILQALFENLLINNLSNSDDSQVMQEALSSKDEVVDIHHAGTAMRFLTAYFSIQEGRTTILTGSERMQERPIGILVDALRDMGAQITYQKNEGYPPLVIKGTTIKVKEVTLQADVSSQYISALMLIGGALSDGLCITLDGKITSVPYIEMTLSLLREVGIQGDFSGQKINILPYNPAGQKNITVESDWSSASYFYSFAALSKNAKIKISSYKLTSIQGDSVLQDIYTSMGVQSTFEGTTLVLERIEDHTLPEYLELDLSNSPDIAQTIAVTCLGLGIGCHLTGLHTLKIKETDRLEALYIEITKLGGTIAVTNDSLELKPQKVPLHEDVSINTYKDHRMAMAFAPLALCTSLMIEDAMVVSKSYPDFWEDLETIGCQIEIIA